MAVKRKFWIGIAVILSIVVMAVILYAVFFGRVSPGIIDLKRTPVFTDNAPGTLSQHYDEIKSKLQPDENGTLEIDENGRLTFFSGKSAFSAEEGFTISDDEAVTMAKQILSELGLLPQDGYRTQVSKTTGQTLTLDGQPDAPATVEYTVYFYRTYNAVDFISDQEDGIVISFCKEGLSMLRYFWRDIKVTKLDNGGRTTLTSEQAYQIYLDNWDERHGTCCDPVADPVITQAYLQIGDTTMPCWVISEDDEYGNAWYINMLSGEILIG